MHKHMSIVEGLINAVVLNLGFRLQKSEPMVHSLPQYTTRRPLSIRHRLLNGECVDNSAPKKCPSISLLQPHEERFGLAKGVGIAEAYLKVL